MMSILKKEQDSENATSCCPVNLTCCAVKNLNIIVNERFKWYLKTRKVI